VPSWWKRAFNESCGELDYGPRRQRIGYPRYPYAGNLAFRRSALSRAGRFSVHLGPVGRRHLDGEEFELCLRVERQGGAIYFDPAIPVHHAVSPQRLTRRFVVHKGFYHGRSMAMVEASHFGRRFALWRSVELRRDLGRRRTKAFTRTADATGADHAERSIDRWLATTAMPQQGGLTLKVLAQGTGYLYQVVAHELWRRDPILPLREPAST
jgi:GT2 family glycosyltransferase